MNKIKPRNDSTNDSDSDCDYYSDDELDEEEDDDCINKCATTAFPFYINFLSYIRMAIITSIITT